MRTWQIAQTEEALIQTIKTHDTHINEINKTKAAAEQAKSKLIDLVKSLIADGPSTPSNPVSYHVLQALIGLYDKDDAHPLLLHAYKHKLTELFEVLEQAGMGMNKYSAAHLWSCIKALQGKTQIETQEQEYLRKIFSHHPAATIVASIQRLLADTIGEELLPTVSCILYQTLADYNMTQANNSNPELEMPRHRRKDMALEVKIQGASHTLPLLFFLPTLKHKSHLDLQDKQTLKEVAKPLAVQTTSNIMWYLSTFSLPAPVQRQLEVLFHTKFAKLFQQEANKYPSSNIESTRNTSLTSSSTPTTSTTSSSSTTILTTTTAPTDINITPRDFRIGNMRGQFGNSRKLACFIISRHAAHNNGQPPLQIPIPSLWFSVTGVNAPEVLVQNQLSSIIPLTTVIQTSAIGQAAKHVGTTPITIQQVTQPGADNAFDVMISDATIKVTSESLQALEQCITEQWAVHNK